MRAAKPARYLFSIAIPITELNNEDVLGILMLQPGEDYIKNALAHIGISGMQIYIFDKNGNLIYRPNYVFSKS